MNSQSNSPPARPRTAAKLHGTRNRIALGNGDGTLIPARAVSDEQILLSRAEKQTLLQVGDLTADEIGERS
jgi:hypothetical protein